MGEPEEDVSMEWRQVYVLVGGRDCVETEAARMSERRMVGRIVSILDREMEDWFQLTRFRKENGCRDEVRVGGWKCGTYI